MTLVTTKKANTKSMSCSMMNTTVSTMLLAFITSSAIAAPIEEGAGMNFYNAPSIIPASSSGNLLAYRTVAVNLGAQAPNVKAWNVKYRSTDSKGVPNIVTGTVLVPTAAWTGTSARPIVSYAVGTHGLNQNCAPSLKMQQGKDYEAANMVAALKQGYALLVTDYAGYTTGSTPTYLSGASQGNAVLDIVRAASQIPSVGLTTNAKVAIWGYSQGGQSAAWAAERQATYAPDINLVGVAAGGIPGDFLNTAHYLDGNNGSSFMLGGIVGLSTQYPDAIPLDTLANDIGKQAISRAKEQCVFESLFAFMNTNLSSYTNGNKTLDQLLADLPAAKAVVKAQDLGNERIRVPFYQYHGQADEFIPLAQSYELKKTYCSKFSNVNYNLYPGEHITTQFQAAPNVLSWIGDRFNGKSALNNSCLRLGTAPQSTANPVNGNFVVSLKDWKLAANIDLKTLKQTVTLPEESTFTADSDMTDKKLTGTMVVPSFKQTLKIIGLPIQVGLTVKPVGLTTGNVSLDNDGQLKIRGTAYADIIVTSVAGIPFGECKTVSPVAFPLSFDGPISALGSGNLTFDGTTSFPQLKGCSISAVLSTLMSGDGQKFAFNVTPPQPQNY